MQRLGVSRARVFSTIDVQNGIFDAVTFENSYPLEKIFKYRMTRDLLCRHQSYGCLPSFGALTM